MSLTKDDLKNAAKEAIKEWLDDQYREFGRWSVRVIAGAAICALLYFILKTNGWSIVRNPLDVN